MAERTREILSSTRTLLLEDEGLTTVEQAAERLRRCQDDPHNHELTSVVRSRWSREANRRGGQCIELSKTTTIFLTREDGAPAAVTWALSTHVVALSASNSVQEYHVDNRARTIRLTRQGYPQLIVRDTNRNRQARRRSGLLWGYTKYWDNRDGLGGYTKYQDRCFLELVGNEKLLQAAHEHLGPLPSPDEMMPLRQRYQLEHQGGPDYRRAFWGTTTAQELTTRLFGRTRVRKDLVRGVALAEPATLHLAWMLRGLVPIDWIITLLRSTALEPGTEQAMLDQLGTMPKSNMLNDTLRRALRQLDQRSLRRLATQWSAAMAGATNAGGRFSDTLFDTAHMLMATPNAANHLPHRIDNWRQLHDLVAAGQREELAEQQARRRAQQEQADRRKRRQAERAERQRWQALTPEQQAAEQEVARLAEQRRREADEQREREAYERNKERIDAHRDLSAAIDEVEVAQGHRIVVATGPEQLLDWGTQMHNCISGYWHRMEDRQSLLAAITSVDGGHVEACLEVMVEVKDHDGTRTAHPVLSQLLGRYNDIDVPTAKLSLDLDTRHAVIELLAGHGVQTNHDWWGKELL